MATRRWYAIDLTWKAGNIWRVCEGVSYLSAVAEMRRLKKNAAVRSARLVRVRLDETVIRQWAAPKETQG
jgi:hypothetical protein